MADTSSVPQQVPSVDSTVPHSARIWNYWLGGKDNFAVDRAVGDQVRTVFPGIVDAARHTRAFLGRAVGHLVSEAGVRQFLDVGTGLPTVDNTHEIAQRTAPATRVVYVDNDPMVLAHARALLTSTPEGVTTYLHADLRDPEGILRGAAEVLDPTKPAAIMLLGIMAHVGDGDEARSIVRRLLAGVPSGSYLVLSDGTDTSEEVVESHRQYNETGAVPYHLRSPEEIGRFFDGLEILAPGIVPITAWRPEDPAAEQPRVDGYCGVGRKP